MSSGHLRAAVDDGIAVDRHADRFTDADIQQRVLDFAAIKRGDMGRVLAELVHMQIDHAV